MIRLTHEQGLVFMLQHYDSEISKEFNNIEFRHSIGVIPTEDSVSKTNEKLYRLFMFKNNISSILNKMYDEED